MSQDLKYGTLYQHLVHNEEPIRQSAMRRLRAFISSKEPSSEDEDDEEEELQELGLPAVEMAKIWRGLFYCYWMSDKDDIQQEFARNLAISIHLWRPYTALTFVNAFFETMADRWSTIDHHRMNKYLSLIRRILEASFIYMRIYDWDEDIVEQFTDIISNTLRKLSSSRRGIGMEIIQMYIKSFAVSYGQDCYFNEINIDEILENNDYDENTSLEAIYYNQYVYRKDQRSGKEAQERFHARRAAKRENAAPLAFKYTKEGRKAAKAEKGSPKNPETGKLLYTNPIAYLINRKQKKIATADTPDVPEEVFTLSRENIGPVPDLALIPILDVLFNCYKLSSKDAALHELLQDHFRNFWIEIVTRFVDNAQYEAKDEENPAPESAGDALGHTAAASLRSLSLYLREKAKSTDDLSFSLQNTNKKAKKPNLADLSLSELPSTSRTRQIYNAIANQLDSQIARLIEIGVDFDQLESREPVDFDGGEGEDGFDPSMYGMGGEGEFDEMMFGEGEMSEEELQHYLDGMNGEGEFGGEFDEDAELDQDEDDIVEDEDFEMDGESEGEISDFDPSMFMNAEGEYDWDALQAILGDGEGEMGEGDFDEDFEGDFDEDEELEDEDEEEQGGDDDDDDDDQVSIPVLKSLFGDALRFDKQGQPILTPSMFAHLTRYLKFQQMKQEADSAQSPLTKKNTQENQQLAAQYVPKDKSKWNYGYEHPVSDSEDDHAPNMKKRKQQPNAHLNDKHSNKKQKMAAPVADSKANQKTRLVNFALDNNKFQTIQPNPQSSVPVLTKPAAVNKSKQQPQQQQQVPSPAAATAKNSNKKIR